MGSWSNRRVSPRPMGKGKLIGCEGAKEEHNRRTLAQIANDRFVKALTEEAERSYRTALLVTCELHKPPTAEELTAFERALERVKAGASISEVIPFKRRADRVGTLAGVGSRWMAS